MRGYAGTSGRVRTNAPSSLGNRGAVRQAGGSWSGRRIAHGPAGRWLLGQTVAAEASLGASWPRGYLRSMHPLVAERLGDLLQLCRRFPVKRLDLFGSAAGGRVEAKDLDFLVEIEDLAPAEYSEAYFGLLEGLEDLFGLPIDLVVESAVTNPYFRESFERTRVRLYAA